MHSEPGTNIALALVGGVALRYGFGLDPVWWLAWVAPVPVLIAALRSSPRDAMILTLLAALIAGSGSYHYFSLVMPLPGAFLVTVMLALLWTLVVGLTRWVILRVPSAWAVLAYPLLWCAADTLLAHLHPDGNWSSLAYSQAGFRPAVQILSLTGVAGLVFVMSLVPAAISLAVTRGLRAARAPVLGALALTVATFAFGWLRIPASPPMQGDLVGLAVIDAFIGPRTPAAQSERVWSQYESHVVSLAAKGARIVVLPEKISTVSPAAAAQLEQRLSALAARAKVWLAVGIGTDDGRSKLNLEWLFAPDGHREASYQKHHLAPPERDFARGRAFETRALGAAKYGLAICKDMHFAEMGRAYGARGVQVMLVPGWDFGEDAEYAARLSALRGVESGFAMVRASREGLLSITDAYGRITAEVRSAPLPGATLLSRVPVEAPMPTVYGRTGDLFGWLCTGAALLLVALATQHTPADSGRSK